ncbi:spore photoproduct lyase [Melghirimyces profundicolus]|uniref:Spore photoproduct lyase n=1 Tax=Melghirimyces profundicolus TaxID=1242148 RepID=A0A2T6C2I3_9BACL|nr:spore photoproduct lyase [Melghirimyces profundicolus]PTX62534.1 spore photoproduct lyase [Melghirimyces profundicolus]
MKPFQPDLIFFEPDALQYPLGQELYDRFKETDIPIRKTTSHNQVRGIPGKTELQKYRMAKNTLVVGVRKTLKFDTSKPSAEYAIPLATGCMGHCHYCYLQTTMGRRPYVRVYVNLDDIFEAAEGYIRERAPDITRFEAACTSDPVGIEHITGSLKKAVEFMGKQELGRLRFVTKYSTVDPLLDARHNGHTRFRFSLNADYVVKYFEPGTAPLQERIEAAGKVARAGYPLGFILAPLMIFDGWEEEYDRLLLNLSQALPPEATKDLTFELISHRFTKTAKNIIQEHYPKTKLNMNEEERQKKWGRYGRYKYVYPKSQLQALREHMEGGIQRYFPEADILYFT